MNKNDIKKIVADMTLEEKAGMCSGEDFWHLKAVERLGVPHVMVSDGPYGLRKQDQSADHLGINDSIKAVCFPAACATASSFDREMLERMGDALGKECRAEHVSILLGPAANIKRSPLCGRNFEYFSEDPYLTGEIAASYIKGVQKNNVGTSLKHFAANNQEYRRMSCSSELDERTFREIYLAGFETAVKEAKPWTMMCSYNRINGVYASENHKLLTEILRDEWGFDGYVMSDWGAVNDRVEGVKAGLDLEMPSSNGENDKEIVKAVKEGRLDEKVLDEAVERILNITFKYVEDKTEEVFDKEGDHEFAVKVEEDSIVLLKNEDNILPLKKNGSIAYIGKFAEKPRFQGGGSSHINAFKVTDALSSSKKYADVSYAQGYITEKDEIDEALEKEAVETAKNAETAVLFVGLPDAFESEGYDRTHMRLPECQLHLIHEVCKVQKNVVIVLHNGSPVEMDFVNDVKGIVELYLGGQGVGEAAANVLFGEVNPSGKLAETFPLKLEHNPSYVNFPGDGKTVEYKEGVFVGYRYYDTKKMDVLFPFGYGLSYTTFEYSNLKLDKKSMKDTDTLTVTVDVKNTGKVKGKEVVQLYVSDKTNAAIRPLKELKNFIKVELNPGETKTVSMTLNKRSFAWYNEEINDWYCASGSYEILIGKSSQDIVLCDTVEIKTDVKLPFTVDENTTLGDLFDNEDTRPVIEKMMKEKMHMGFEENEAISSEMMKAMMENFPIRSMKSFAGLSNEDMHNIINALNDSIR